MTPALAQEPMSSVTPSGLSCAQSAGVEIQKILAQPDLQRTRWGVDIRLFDPRSRTSKSLYQRNAKQLFLPASSAKLFSALTLSGHFRETHRLATEFWAEGNMPNLQSLTVIGQGDPSILGPQLERVATELKQKGVKSIQSLAADSRAFAAPFIIPSWEWVDLQTSDGVPITSLSFSQNSLPLKLTPQSEGQPLKLEWLDGKPYSPLIIKNETLTVAKDAPEFVSLTRNLAGTVLNVQGHLRQGAAPDVSYVAIANPEEYFLSRLRQSLQAAGIRVGSVKVLTEESQGSKNNPTGQKIATIQSPPLSRLLQEVNQSSNNFYTESLLRYWAWQSPPVRDRQPVTPHQSLKQLEEYLATLGVDPASYELKDASGLSRQNLVSPESLISLLEASQKWRGGQISDRQKSQTFINSLAVAGEAGTLKRRFLETPVVGRFKGKTGTLRGTVTLAGMLEMPDQSVALVAILANQSDLSTSRLRKTVDAMILQLDQTLQCSTTR